VLSLPKEMAAAVNDFRFRERLKTESEAIRRLIEMGLEASAKPQPAKRASKPQAKSPP
jgi:hypothetical protein